MYVRKRGKKKQPVASPVTGLRRLSAKPLPPRAGSEVGKDEYAPGIIGDYFCLTKKESGVEPGFFAVEINEAFYQRFNEITASNLSPEACLEYLQWMEEEDRNSLARTIYEEGKKGTVVEGQTKLDLLMFKQHYKEPGILGVTPDVENLSQTRAIQKKLKYLQKAYTKGYEIVRARTPSEENINAVLECLATEFARAYGMQAQEQQLILSSYVKGDTKIKIMTVCVWEPGLEPIENGEAGSLRRDDYENYLVRAAVDRKGELVKLSSANGQYFISDHSIHDLGECLPLFIAQCDRDVWGSHMQNKKKKNNRVYGYDFGHAYRHANDLLKPVKNSASGFNLQDDFSFTQPRRDYEKFKNFSVCYDTEMTERMGGMFFLYKMCEQSIRDDCFSAEEQHNIEKAIQSYIDESPDFRERYAKTQAGCAEKIFYDYYFKFIELAVTSEDKKNFSEFIKYASSIHEANKMAIGDMKTMFKIFKDKMQLSQLEIRLLSNLEKLTSETSLTSQDGKVILNHLRIKPGKKIPWEMHLDRGHLHFTANVPKKDAKNLHEMLSDYWKAYCKNDDIKLFFAENIPIVNEDAK